MKKKMKIIQKDNELYGGYMDLIQTKLIGLTMQLELKAQEYNLLCEKFEKLKIDNIEENNSELLNLRDEFQKNHDEIAEINEQLEVLGKL